MIEYIVIAFVVLCLEAMHDARYSKQLTYMDDAIKEAIKLLSVAQYYKPELGYSPEKASAWNVEAKIIKGFAILAILMLCGSWAFAITYIVMRSLIFSILHSYFWLGELQSLKWYLEHNIYTKMYNYVKSFF